MPAAVDLQSWRDKLVALRVQGIRVVTDQSGESITYSSDREMAAAIASIDRELAALAGGRRPSSIRFNTSKGL